MGTKAVHVGFLNVILIFGILKMGQGLDCRNVMTVESEGLLNYLATVRFPIPIPLHEEPWVLEMKTDHEFTFLGGWNVWVSNKPAEGKATFRSRDENITMAQGEELSFRFRMKWFTDEPRPEPISMIWQEHQICANGTSVQPILAERRRRMDGHGIPMLGGRRPYGVARRRMRFPVN